MLTLTAGNGIDSVEDIDKRLYFNQDAMKNANLL
jgi:hypothetical protein